MPRILVFWISLVISLNLSGAFRPLAAQDVNIPNFWDNHERFPKPDLSSLPRLRFLTTTDFPPFNFIDRKKRLSGFHVDLARAICAELDLLNRCQIKALPWNKLEKALAAGEGEAIIAGLAMNAQTRQKYGFSRPYFRIPGRFVARRGSGLVPPVYDALFKRTVGVIDGSAHAVYFAKSFGERKFETFPSREAALLALMENKVDAVFSDALSLSFWLASSASKDCCAFVDGPFLSEEYFGNGMAIALPKQRETLTRGINHALKNISDKGTFAELYLRYFPVGLF